MGRIAKGTIAQGEAWPDQVAVWSLGAVRTTPRPDRRKHHLAPWFPERLTLRDTLALMCAMLIGAPLQVAAQSVLPTGGNVTHGSASIGTPSADDVTIDQSSTTAIIDWGSFSVGQPNSVQFNNGSGATLNRVVGADPSQIHGALGATGSLYLINENGITVGPTGRIQTGGNFVGSTRDIANEDFLNGKANTFSGTSTGDIVNQGSITSLGGDVVLIARQVTNSGDISAATGTAAMAAGNEILLNDVAAADGLMFVKLPSADARVGHDGTITAASAELRANGGNIYTLAGNRSGEIHATGSTNENGRIFLTADGGNVSVASDLTATRETNGGDIVIEASGLVSATGTLDASGDAGGTVSVLGANILAAGRIAADASTGDGGSLTVEADHRVLATSASHFSADGSAAGGIVRIAGGASDGGGVFSSGTATATGASGSGGEVRVLGEDLDIVAATMDVSGDTGGGHIAIGYEGKRTSPAVSAKTVDVSGRTVLKADAYTSGDGGTIAAWSQDSTVFAATSFARGGSTGGDGGVVEASSLSRIVYGGVADASARNGTKGMLLLDPKNLTIDNSLQTVLAYDIADPNAKKGNQFGKSAVDVGNGNIAIASPQDDFAATNAGAVYLFNKQTGALISTLLGSTAKDEVGAQGITVLSNGNYVVRSGSWDNGDVANAGAVTWGNGSSGLTGVVSAGNSLVGSTANDKVGSRGVTVLSSGNYIVKSDDWDNDDVANVGAVTWGNGSTGIAGAVSAANSLVGSTANDKVGGSGVTLLGNGNYVVRSNDWDNGTIVDAGAVTWGSGSTGVSGVVSAANSLVRSTSGDGTSAFVTVLSNGNYVVRSSKWDNGTIVDAGAFTWGNGSTGITGVVSPTNSLVGSSSGDGVNNIVSPLSNGNYVVGMRLWDNGIVADAGAATWGSGSTGVTGVVSAANSLVGSSENDQVGIDVTALSNGNYVVRSGKWDNGTVVNVGAVTWGNGSTGVTGVVSTTNSLVGSSENDQVGNGGITALSNGNYVVRSSIWDNGDAANVGAVTWGNGSTGVTGVVSAANSLVGSAVNDKVGGSGVTALSNGNYVVRSGNWGNGTVANVGAVTWGNGSTGVTGVVSAANSLVGGSENDHVGSNGVTALSNGNYVVRSGNWGNGTVANVGAVTWGNGSTGVTGVVSSANSLVGSSENDQVGSNSVTVLSNGNYVVRSSIWDNGTIVDAGAVTWGNGSTGVTGIISAANSLVGGSKNDQVGSNGVAALSNGNYVVRSGNWGNGTVANAGAVTWGNGSGGTTGIASAANSIVGSVRNVSLGRSVELSDDGTFVVSSPRDGTGGRVIVGSAEDPNTLLSDPNVLTFGFMPSGDISVHASIITDTLDKGTDVVLQANNDITFNSAVVANNPDGDGGNLAALAGRSILVNADITSDNGSVFLFANGFTGILSGAGAVVPGNRDDGSANIVLADGVSIDAGTGGLALVTLPVDGKALSAPGDIILTGNNTLTGGEVQIVTLNEEGDAEVRLGAGSQINASAEGTGILVGTSIFTNNAGADVFNLTGDGRFLVFSKDYEQDTRGGIVAGNLYNRSMFEKGFQVTEVDQRGNQFVFERQPTLTLTANDVTRSYGADNPDLTFTASGLVNGDTQAQALGSQTPSVATIATTTSNVADYVLTMGLTKGGGKGLRERVLDIGYAVETVNGTLSVTPAELTVTANDASREYGLANPDFSGTVTGFRNRDDATVVSGLTFGSQAMAGSGVGDFAIVSSGGTATNYVIGTRNNGTLSVTPAELTVTANDETRDEGAGNPAFSATVTGLRGRDDASVVTGLGFLSDSVAASPAGVYFIRPIGGTAANYTLTRVDGVLTVVALPAADGDNETQPATPATTDRAAIVASVRIVETPDTSSGFSVSSLFTDGVNPALGGIVTASVDDGTEGQGATGTDGDQITGRLVVEVEVEGESSSGGAFSFQLPPNFTGCASEGACDGVPDSVFFSNFAVAN